MNPTFRKKDRVATSVPYKGEIRYGLVRSISGGKVHVVLDDGAGLAGPARLFRFSNKLLPESIAPSVKKGDRVEFDGKGGVEHGVATKVDVLSVSITLDGGEYRISVKPSCVRISSRPLAKDTIATPMDSYEVRGYRPTAGHDDSPSFVANIYKDGKKIAVASNDGWGGCNSYHGCNHSEVAKFEQDAREWAIAFGNTKPFEPDSTWIHWYVFLRPFGVTSEAHLAKYRQNLAALDA